MKTVNNEGNIRTFWTQKQQILNFVFFLKKTLAEHYIIEVRTLSIFEILGLRLLFKKTFYANLK